MRRLAAKVATRPGSTDVVAASTFHSSACPAPATANRQIFSFGVNTYGVSLLPPDGVLIEPASASGGATITRIIGIKNAQLLDGRCGRVSRYRRHVRAGQASASWPLSAPRGSPQRACPASRWRGNPERRERIGSESTDGWTLLIGASTDDDARRFARLVL